jgi:hypothetical protein
VQPRPPAAIFINYRTGDGEHAAKLIDNELADRFGTSNVFLAHRDIPPTADFTRGLINGVRHCSVLVALIGPRWLDALDCNGPRALDQEPDWTRREIATAFECDVPVLPVLLGHTPRLTGAPLPPDIAPLTRCQYLRYDTRRSTADLAEIVKAICTIVPYLRVTKPATTPAGSRPDEATTPQEPTRQAPKYDIKVGRDSHIYERDVHLGSRP